MKKLLVIIVLISLVFTVMGCNESSKIPEGVSEEVYNGSVKYIRLIENNMKEEKYLIMPEVNEIIDFCTTLNDNGVSDLEKDILDNLMLTTKAVIEMKLAITNNQEILIRDYEDEYQQHLAKVKKQLNIK